MIMKSTSLILLLYTFILHHLLHVHIAADKNIIDKSFTFRAEIFNIRYLGLVFCRLLLSFITEGSGLSFLHLTLHATKL